MALLSSAVFRARLNYQKVQELTGWDHMMVNDYLGITQGTQQIVAAIDDNKAAISVNAQAISDNEQFIASLIVENGKLNAWIKENADSIEDAHQMIAALILQLSSLRAKLEQVKHTADDALQLAGRV